MGHTIVGVFRHSGDADLAAAHLQEEFTLAANQLDVVGNGEGEQMSRPGLTDGVDNMLTAVTGTGVGPEEDQIAVGKRWGDKVEQGKTLVVARTHDPEMADAMAQELRASGADQVDIITQ